MKNILSIYLFLLLAGCSQRNAPTEDQSSELFVENVSIDTLQKPPTVDSTGIKHVPKNNFLNRQFILEIMTHKVNRKIRWHDKTYLACICDVNLPGKSFSVTVVNDSLDPQLGGVDSRTGEIILNRGRMHKMYINTRNFLINCRLDKYIVDEYDFYESVFLQELWHVFNTKMGAKESEYYSEFPSLNSKGGDFYLVFKYVDISPSWLTRANENYKFMFEHYVWAFEIKEKIELSEIESEDKFINLIATHTFQGLKNRYKGLE